MLYANSEHTISRYSHPEAMETNDGTPAEHGSPSQIAVDHFPKAPLNIKKHFPK